MKNDPRPVVSVIGWSNIREKVSLNLAKYLVTRIGKDDTVSEIISKLDIHILFSKSLPYSLSNVSTSLCPSSHFSLDNKLKVSLGSWSSKKNMTSSVLTLCQALGVSPALARVSSCLKCTQLVGDSAQAFDTRSLYNLFSDFEHCVANHQVTYRKMCPKKQSILTCRMCWEPGSRARA